MTIQSSRGDMVLGNEIQKGVALDLGPTAGLASTASGQDGLFVTGVVTGTQVLDNEISTNSGDGVMLVNAKRLTIGGIAPGAGNGIVSNLGYGLYAFGICSGTVVQKNMIAANAKGNVNLSGSRGITYIP